MNVELIFKPSEIKRKENTKSWSNLDVGQRPPDPAPPGPSRATTSPASSSMNAESDNDNGKDAISRSDGCQHYCLRIWFT